MKAIILMAFGSPSSLDEVESFLSRLMKGRKPSAEQVERVKNRYRLIGGSSPLLDITINQANCLEKRLAENGYFLKSFVGMLYSSPLIEENLKKMIQEGVKEIIAIPMTPFRSRFSTQAYRNEIERVIKVLKADVSISFLEGWHKHPLFIDAVKEKIEEELMKFSERERRDVFLLFTAHSLPKSAIEDDPYLFDLEETIHEVLKKLNSYQWGLAFQSRGSGEEKWLEPEVESVLEALSKRKIHRILIIPIGFVSDHVEILYDIDIFYKKKAESLGMELKRSPSLNSSSKFIEALSSIIIEEYLKKERLNKK